MTEIQLNKETERGRRAHLRFTTTQLGQLAHDPIESWIGMEQK